MAKEDDVLANSFMYVQSDIPEGMTLSAYRASKPAQGPTNRAYALALAASASIVALPNVIAAIVNRRHHT